MRIVFRSYILPCFFLLATTIAVAQPSLTIKRAQVATWPTVEVFYEIQCIGQLNITHTAGDIILREDGLPVSAFTVVSPDTTLHHPMSVAMVFDASDASGGVYNPTMRRAGDVFIDKLDGSGDEAALLFFNAAVTLQQPMTTSRSTLHSQLATLGLSGDRALRDAMHAGVTHAANVGQNTNRAVVVASVGFDNASGQSVQDIIELARARSVRVYTVGIGSGFDTQTLKTVADSTGGVFHSVPDTAQLNYVYQQIYEHISDLGRESRLTYSTACQDGALHQLSMLLPDLCTGQDSASTAFRKPDDPLERMQLDLQILDVEAAAGTFVNVPIAVLNPVQGVLQPSEIGFSFPKSALQLQEVAVTGSSPLREVPVDVVPVGDNYIVRTHGAAIFRDAGVVMSLRFFIPERVDSISCVITPRSSYTASGCLLPVLHAGRVNVSVSPRPVIEAVGPSSVCPGDSVRLRVTQEFDTYAWTTGDTTRSIVARSSGEYAVVVTDHAGRSGISVPFTVQVFDAPAPRLTASDTVALCAGHTLPLATSEPFASYRWSTGDTTASIVIDSAGTYHVAVTDATGCTGVSDTVVVILDDPTVEILADGPLTICEGDTLRLRASGSFTAWRWNNGGGDREIAVTATGRFVVRATNIAGCEAWSDTVDVMVLPRPVATITSSKAFTVCPNDSLVLDAQDGFTQYIWSTGETTRRIVVRTPGTYTVRVAGANGCFSSPARVDIDAAVRPALAPGGVQVACYGESVDVAASAGYVAYRWNTGDTTRTASITLSGDYWVDATDAGGCIVRSDTVTIHIRRRIEPTISIDGSLNLCEGDSVTLSAPIGYFSYYWSTGETTSRIVVRDRGEYHVTVYDNELCSGTSRDVSVSLRARPPKPDIVRQDAELTAPLASSYQWYRNGAAIPDAGGRGYLVRTNGWYAVEVYNEYGCGMRSDEIEVIVVSVETMPDNIGIAVYPQPSEGIVQVEVHAASLPVHLHVMNLLGQTVASYTADEGGTVRHRFDLRAQAPGLYLLRVDTGGEILLRRFVTLPSR